LAIYRVGILGALHQCPDLIGIAIFICWERLRLQHFLSRCPTLDYVYAATVAVLVNLFITFALRGKANNLNVGGLAARHW